MEADISSQAVGLASSADFSLLSLFIRADFIVKSVIIITNTCKTEDAIKLLFTFFSYLSLYGSEIKATFVKPDPERSPIISKTLP